MHRIHANPRLLRYCKANAMQIRRANLDDLAAAQLLLQEYYEAIGVLKRDTPEELIASLSAPDAGFWIASVDGSAAGCVALRPLPHLMAAGECKRLYVRPPLRGVGVAIALLDTLESGAFASGYHWLYLDSNDNLQAALGLYRKRGYLSCERYNDNPQATQFLRKDLRVSRPSPRESDRRNGSAT